MSTTIWLDTVDFNHHGQWQTETQFVREMAQPYLIASHTPGVPVEDAVTEFTLEEDGYYRFFVRTKNWKYPEAPGQFSILADGTELSNICGKMPVLYWYWEIAGDIYLKKGTHKIALHDRTGWLSRCAAVIITNDMDFTPTPEPERLLKQRLQIKGLQDRVANMGKWDFVVVGAGPGGIPAAISAARKGLKVALICARPTIGGNASDEGTIGFDGAGAKHLGYHETGIANEIKCVREHFGLTWQGALEYLVGKESNITLFKNMMCTDAETDDNFIKSIHCVDTMTLKKYCFESDLYADCSGDGWLGYYAGAAYRLGREAKHEFDEEFAPEAPDTLTMSGCNCADIMVRNFLMEKCDEVNKFIAPDWAIKFPKEIYRTPKPRMTSEWWLENSNDYDDLWDNEFARDTLVRIGVGYFDWLKNSYANKEFYNNYRLKSIALHNSKRENRRIIGDYILSQSDYTDETVFEDAISYHGWGVDVHHIKGIYSGEEGPFHLDMKVPVGPVPYRCLYSKNIKNMFIASRCGSFSHLGLGSVRVENTIATMGQAVGTAAYLCKKYDVLPREIYMKYIEELQQILICDDQTIIGVVNKDARDKAREAKISATSFNAEKCGYPENVVNGEIRSYEEKCNAWISDEKQGLPQSITLEFEKPEWISSVHITSDTDLTYPLFSPYPLNLSNDILSYDYTACDMSVEVYTGNEWKMVARIKENFCRKSKVCFEAEFAEKVRVTVIKTSGAQCAKLNEIRIYGE